MGAALLGFPVRVMVLDGVSELLAKGMDTCMCVAESPRYSPETITALLIGYTPIQKKSWKKKNSDPKKGKNLLPRKGPSLPCQGGSQNVKVSQNTENMIKQAHCSIPSTASVRGFYSQNEYFSAGAEPGGTPLYGRRPTAAVGEQRDSSAERGAPVQEDWA